MPRVSRLSGTATTSEGFAVETSSGGSTYRYELRILDHGGDESPGRAELSARYRDGQEVEPEITPVVRDAMNERGFEVEA